MTLEEAKMLQIRPKISKKDASSFMKWKKLSERERRPPQAWPTRSYIYQKIGLPIGSLPREVEEIKFLTIQLKRLIKHVYFQTK
jgi:hypothetical protein